MESTNNQIDPQDLATVSQLSRDWKVTRVSIYKWIEDGNLKQVIYNGKKKIDRTTFNPKYPKGVREGIEAYLQAKAAKNTNQSK